MDPTPQSPVFVVGSPRAGTSILTHALLSTGYHGYREGHLLSLLRILDELLDRHFAEYAIDSEEVLISRVDKGRFAQDVFDVFKRHADELNPSKPWIDKTGDWGMIMAIPILLRLWPTASFLFAKRRAIENIVSRTKKFPDLTFEYHCTNWSQTMACWRQVKEKVPNLREMEIDQQD